MIADPGWLAVAPLAVQHYSVEMSTLFVGLLVVGILFGWGLFSGFSIARSINRTAGVLLNRRDSNAAVDNSYVGCLDETADNARAAKTHWDNLLRIEQMEAEQKEVQQRGTAKLADQFQAALGTLMGMGSPACTKTAESTEPRAGAAASHSEAPAPARSLRPVPADITSSVNEFRGPIQGASNNGQEVAGRVDDALKSIPAIAERINTPALNAVIAGVRAGEAGKGFTLVARELMVVAAEIGRVLERLGVHIGEMQATMHDTCSPSKTSRLASCAPERALRRSHARWKSRNCDAGDRPRRRRSGLR